MKKLNCRLAAEPNPGDETRLWVFAFIILLAVSLWMLTMRLLNDAFLALDFEVTIVYLPTVLAGVITLYLSTRTRPNQ